MLRRLLIVGTISATVAALMLFVTPAFGATNTDQDGDASLGLSLSPNATLSYQRTTLNVTIAYNCSVNDNDSDVDTGNGFPQASMQVSVTQYSGRNVVTGQAQLGGGGGGGPGPQPAQPTCDGEIHTATLSMTGFRGGDQSKPALWSGGRATAQVNGQNCESFDFNECAGVNFTQAIKVTSH